MKNNIIDMLLALTNRPNDEVKITAISALGDYKATAEQRLAIDRLIELCNDPNKDVAISAIKALSKLSEHL